MPPSPTEPAGVRKPKAKPAHTKSMVELLKAVEEELSVRADTEEAAKGGPADADTPQAQAQAQAQAPKPKLKLDESGMKPWAEIDTIYRDMSLLLSHTPLDVHSVTAALSEVRRLQGDLRTAISTIEKRHARR